MKKLLFISGILLIGLSLQNCSSSDEDGHEADGHIMVTVTLHDEVNDVHNPVEGATVQMWFNKSSAEGAADFNGVTDATGLAEFEELENGIYFITATAMDEGVEKSGSELVEVSEANHEVDVEIDLD